MAHVAPTLHTTRLVPPPVAASWVLRERLLHALDASLQQRLTLLSAAAGWGKTTLLSAWVSRYPHAVIWISLDERDNNPTHFWTALITACIS